MKAALFSRDNQLVMYRVQLLLSALCLCGKTWILVGEENFSVSPLLYDRRCLLEGFFLQIDELVVIIFSLPSVILKP